MHLHPAGQTLWRSLSPDCAQVAKAATGNLRSMFDAAMGPSGCHTDPAARAVITGRRGRLPAARKLAAKTALSAY